MIEAGPCFVTAIRRAERDGYDAVQLAFGEISEKKLQKARRGHLAEGRRGQPPPPLRVPRRGRRARGGRRGEGRLRVREGRDREGLRRLEGQGLRRHDQAPQLPPRARVPRLAQRARPGLDRRLRRSRARLQGHPRPRPDGQQARDPARPRGRGRPRRRATCCSCAAPCRAPRAASSRSGRTPDGRRPRRPSSARSRASSTLDESRVRRALPRAARARDGARRAGRAPPRHRVHQDARRGRDDRRQGLAPEGHRPRPRGRPLRVAAHRRRRGLRAQAARATRSRSTARPPRRALRAALALHADRGSLAGVDASAWDAPSTKQAAAALEHARRPAAACSWCSPTARRPVPSPSATSPA